MVIASVNFAHACRNGDYDKLRPINRIHTGRSNHGAKKWGFYGACSDHIASEYAAHARRNNKLMYPDGSAYIGLLFVKDDAGEGAASIIILDNVPDHDDVGQRCVCCS